MSPPPPPGGRTGPHSSAVAAITSALHTTVPGPAGGGGMPRPAKTSRDHRVPHVSLTLQYREEGTVASQRGLRLRRLHQFAAALPGAFGNRPAAAVYGTSNGTAGHSPRPHCPPALREGGHGAGLQELGEVLLEGGRGQRRVWVYFQRSLPRQTAKRMSPS